MSNLIFNVHLIICTEVTALRSKLAEITQAQESSEKEMRDRVKGEFIDLVVDLVNVNNGLKSKIDHFK